MIQSRLLTIAAILILLSTIGGMVLDRLQKNKIDSLESLVESQQAELKMRRNSQGQLIAEKEAAQIQVSELKNSMPRLREQIEREFELKIRNLRGYSQTNFEARGQGNADIIIRHDTSVIMDPDLMDSYLTVTAIPMPNNKPGYYYISNDDTVRVMLDPFGHPIFKIEPFALVAQDGYLDFHAEVYSETRAPYEYSYSDTLKYAYHFKRDKWYGRKKLYGSALMSNPNARVLNTQAYLIDSYREKRFGIGPHVGYGLSPNGLQWNVGISVHYGLIRF
jgi:hypothetical protein